MRTIRSKSSITTTSIVNKLVVNTSTSTIKKPSIVQVIKPESKNMILTNFYAQRKLVSTKPRWNSGTNS